MPADAGAAAIARRLSERVLGLAAAERRRPVFRGANLEAQTTTLPEFVLSGPAGTGKSVALLARLHANAEAFPGSRQLIIRKTRASLTQSGLTNVLNTLGVLKGKPASRKELGQKPTRWVQALDWQDYRFAPESGVYENIVPLGQDVAAGTVVGAIHFLERPERDPIEVIAPSKGVLIATRAPSIATQGDCVAVIAHDVDPRKLP